MKGLKYNQKLTINNDNNNVTNQTLLNSKIHIRKAKAQHMYLDNKGRKYKEDRRNSLYCNYSSYVITFDYVQNLQLFYFGEKQPDDTYLSSCYASSK